MKRSIKSFDRTRLMVEPFISIPDTSLNTENDPSEKDNHKEQGDHRTVPTSGGYQTTIRGLENRHHSGGGKTIKGQS